MHTICPICGRNYTVNGTTLTCEHCHYSIHDSSFVTLESGVEPYVRDSVMFMEKVLNGKVLLAYGQHQLFDKDFSLQTTVIVPIDARCVGEYADGEMKVLLSLGKAFSKFYVQDLYNGISFCTQINPTLRDNKTTGSLILQWACYNESQLTAAEEQALSAYVSPTWFDVAEVLLYRPYKSICDMSESEIFYNVLSCNKAAVVQDFRSALRITEKLAEHVIHLTKFCIYNNVKKCVPNPSTNTFLIGTQFQRAVKAVTDSVPDLITTNSHIVFNNFIFGTSSCLTLEDPLLANIRTHEDLKHIESNARLFNRLWKAFGEPTTKASIESYESLVRQHWTPVPDTMAMVVVRYWEIIRNKLEAKYT